MPYTLTELDTSKLTTMRVSQLAYLVKRDWNPVSFGAAPYLDAMTSLDKIEDNFGAYSGSSIVSYFLSNAATWHGETAKIIKKELHRRLK